MTEIPHLTLEEEKAKNRLSFPPVLAMDKNPKTSTNHQIQTHSCWGRTIKRSITSLARGIPQCTHFPVRLVKPLVPTQQCPAPPRLHEHHTAAKSIRYTACHVDPIIWTQIQQQTEDLLCAQDTQLLFLASIWPVTLPHRSTTAGLAVSKPPQLTPPTKSMHEQAGGEGAASTLMHPPRGMISKFQIQNPASVL